MCVRWRMALHSRRSSNSSLTNNTHYLSFTRYKLAALDSSRASKRRRLNGGGRNLQRPSRHIVTVFLNGSSLQPKWRKQKRRKQALELPSIREQKTDKSGLSSFCSPFFTRRLVDYIMAAASAARARGKKGGRPTTTTKSFMRYFSSYLHQLRYHKIYLSKTLLCVHFYRSLDLLLDIIFFTRPGEAVTAAVAPLSLEKMKRKKAIAITAPKEMKLRNQSMLSAF